MTIDGLPCDKGLLFSRLQQLLLGQATYEAHHHLAHPCTRNRLGEDRLRQKSDLGFGGKWPFSPLTRTVRYHLHHGTGKIARILHHAYTPTRTHAHTRTCTHAHTHTHTRTTSNSNRRRRPGWRPVCRVPGLWPPRPWWPEPQHLDTSIFRGACLYVSVRV